tara:strand:- start:136 stop:558 length:423 start_codon:yes stop_codon:yes gene_type:complete
MDLRNDPYYQNGLLKGRTIILNIDNTTFGSIAKALQVKRKLVDKLTKQYGWDETHPDVSEVMGIIAALEEEQSTIESNEPIYQLTEIDVMNTASDMGMKISTKYLKEVHKRYPQLQEDHPDTEWNLLVEHLLNELNNENI